MGRDGVEGRDRLRARARGANGGRQWRTGRFWVSVWGVYPFYRQERKGNTKDRLRRAVGTRQRRRSSYSGRPGKVARRGGVAPMPEASRGGGSGGGGFRATRGVGASMRRGDPRGGEQRRRPTAAAPLFPVGRGRRCSGGWFHNFQNFKGLTEKQNFLLI